jgi:tRNA-uridine 2-sulfurtransferase
VKRKTVLLAMSGGVDSSVAAYLLQKKDFSVIGLTFKLWTGNECSKHQRKGCCSADAINDAKSVCAKLGVPHYVMDYADEFKKKVVDNFLDSYKKHLTPNPCIICNTLIKFPILSKKAKELGVHYIATGHHAICAYSRTLRCFCIRQAKDKNKDQSYVLFGLSQDILRNLILPVGSFTKDRIRSIAKTLGLKAYYRQESQEICFVTDNNLPGFLKNQLKKHVKPGSIKDKAGKVLAQHDGTCFFTIGQRRGLKIPYGRPIYVTDIDQKTGDITIGEYSDTLRNNILVKGISWTIPPESFKDMENITVKIRYRHDKARAALNIEKDGICEVIFKSPQSAPTPGQAAVFYKGSTVIGGGWIAHK